MKAVLKALLAGLLSLLLFGCSGGDHQDLRQWMEESSRDIRGRIPPLPEMKPYEPPAYSAAAVPDPFRPAKVDRSEEGGGGSGPRPDASRPRESLESFALETLRYVGSLTKNQVTYAVIQAEGRLWQLRPGNYLGHDFGEIRKITPTEIVLREWVQDAGGAWTERESILSLQETETKK